MHKAKKETVKKWRYYLRSNTEKDKKHNTRHKCQTSRLFMTVGLIYLKSISLNSKWSQSGSSWSFASKKVDFPKGKSCLPQWWFIWQKKVPTRHKITSGWNLKVHWAVCREWSWSDKFTRSLDRSHRSWRKSPSNHQSLGKRVNIGASCRRLLAVTNHRSAAPKTSL